MPRSSRVFTGVKCAFLIVAALAGLLAMAGANCDSITSASFRQTAAGPIGDGIKTILGAVIDGAVAVVKDAGDGSSSSSTSTGNGT